MISLKNWFQCNLIGKNSFLLAITLCLITLPASKLGINNVAFVFLAVTCFINKKLLKFNANKALYFPIAYYLLITLSLVWSINIDASLSALSKELSLILFPLLYLFLPKFTRKEIKSVLRKYSYAMAIYSVFIIINATSNYLKTNNIDVFFYHELVTLEINAIYISVIFSVAFLFLIRNNLKKWWDYLAAVILFILIILLSSKNIIVITIILSTLSFITFRKKININHISISSVVFIVIMLAFGSKIYDRFEAEFKDFNENIILENGVENVSIKNALYQDEFTLNHYFSGTSLRLYQARLLKEFIIEDQIFLTGYGVNASQDKIVEKQIERGYQPFFGELNFHNQYLQSFAELGIFGFLIFLIIISYSIYKAIKNKDFDFLVFIILITSLSITESIFNRQRGVVFFITFYCIYHHKKRNENAI